MQNSLHPPGDQHKQTQKQRKLVPPLKIKLKILFNLILELARVELAGALNLMLKPARVELASVSQL